jgi:hypothetical protein
MDIKTHDILSYDIYKIVVRLLDIPNLISCSTLGGENTPTTMDEENILQLKNCLDLTLRDISVHYIPFSHVRQITITNNAYSLITINNMQKLLFIKDLNNQSVSYEEANNIIYLPNGTYYMGYEIVPTSVIDSSIIEEVPVEITTNMLVYGTNKFYCLSKGLCDEADMWNKLYKDEIAEAVKKTGNIMIKDRRWE